MGLTLASNVARTGRWSDIKIFKQLYLNKVRGDLCKDDSVVGDGVLCNFVNK